MLYVSEPKNSVPFIAGVVLVDLVDKICLHPDGVVLQQGSYVGINRIWIHQSLRRKGVATMLVNTSRRLINPKAPVDKTKVAFFAPSGPGLEFVLAYYGSKNGKYLTYDY
jgi:hypothetical protein